MGSDTEEMSVWYEYPKPAYQDQVPPPINLKGMCPTS